MNNNKILVRDATLNQPYFYQYADRSNPSETHSYRPDSVFSGVCEVRVLTKSFGGKKDLYLFEVRNLKTGKADTDKCGPLCEFLLYDPTKPRVATGWVNVYEEDDGKLEFGTKVFDTHAGAHKIATGPHARRGYKATMKITYAEDVTSGCDTLA